MSVAENIKYLRKQKHMTQKQLSEKTGLAVITIQQYEAGKYSPKHDNLIKLATALECEVSDIDESIIIIPIPKFKPTSEDIERARQGAEARRLAAKLESGEDITDEEHQIITDYIEQEKEGIPRLRQSIKNFSNVIDKWGEHILITKYRELNISGKREAVKRIDELTELSQYTNPDEPDTPQE